MIKSIELSNFQSHKDTQIEFTPGLNVITGSSESGKSSIIRALLWVFNNRPLGDEFKSWFSNESELTRTAIEFDDNWIVKERRKGKNVYETESGTLEAFRSDLPEEVSQITRITDYNIQTQHQPYFLLQDKPGEVARRLNEFVGLDVIDRIYSNLNVRISRTKTEINSIESNQTRLQSDINSLAYLDAFSAQLEELDKLSQEIKNIAGRIANLLSLNESIVRLNNEISKISKILQKEKTANKLKALLLDYQDRKNSFNQLSSLVTETKLTKEKLESEKEWLQVESKYLEIKKDIQEKKIILDKVISLVTYKDSVDSISDQLEYITKTRYTLKEKYISVLEKAKVCPICKSAISGKIIQEIGAKL